MSTLIIYKCTIYVINIRHRYLWNIYVRANGEKKRGKELYHLTYQKSGLVWSFRKYKAQSCIAWLDLRNFGKVL